MTTDIKFIVYRSNKRRSNIKFESMEEAEKFIDWDFHDGHKDVNSNANYYDIFEYPYGNFRKRFVPKEIDGKMTLVRQFPSPWTFKEPRKRSFKD